MNGAHIWGTDPDDHFTTEPDTIDYDYVTINIYRSPHDDEEES